MRRLFENKVFIISLVVVILFILAALTAGEDSKLNVVRNVLSVPLNPLQKGIQVVGDKIKDSINFFREVRTAREKNVELEKKLQEAERELEKVYRLEKENENLKSLLSLKNNSHRNWSGVTLHPRILEIGLKYSQLTGEARME